MTRISFFYFIIALAVHIPTTSLANNDYDFKMGHWQITAKVMKPDQTYVQGIGSGKVYRNDVGIIEDELCIDMEHMSDVVGTTLRTLDPVKNIWYITWVGLGSPSGSGTALKNKSMVIESFPGKDEHGVFMDQMTFTLHSTNHYEANLSRTYQNGGVKLDCIWCYQAKRVPAPAQSECQLIQKK